ncbi:hypothetical protein LNV23_16295 [Paucibacter sp. DJ1R-11]|uniref:hypothetical protein n=1 Tax=Paucibacter sp. DJ1R-11 TaxID=2893556 RepID=UPI0021E4EF0F|nr:hypothetical protein [Paucibacter sp. DJ1R-11]MCV2365014.1 hypothetical protein [Paucibacter sp. DJ1R-11]
MSNTTSIYYVKASPTGSRSSPMNASCSYFADPACQQPISGTLVYGQGITNCQIAQASGSGLQLKSATYDTLNQPAASSTSNFVTAVNGVVTIPMPADGSSTKGVILVFSDANTSALYPSYDPQIRNNGN